MKSGTKMLRIASIILIVFGVVSILTARVLLYAGDASAADLSGTTSLGVLVLYYGGAIFQILAGIIGLAVAQKKSLLTVVLGVLLFIPQLAHFYNIKGNIAMIIVGIIALAVPYLYTQSAYKNFREG